MYNLSGQGQQFFSSQIPMGFMYPNEYKLTIDSTTDKHIMSKYFILWHTYGKNNG